jgi:hypothetical protein
MPSIEIACVGLGQERKPPPTSFDIAFEAGLVSHRAPSRFQSDFDARAGSIYHLGNPGQNAAPSGAFTAYELLSDKCLDQEPLVFLEFAQLHVPSLKKLLPWLLESSPDGLLLFTSDYQFGPDAAARFGPITLEEFWSLHDSRRLQMNALYPISRS